jgi:hypothetical protein
MYLSYSCFVVGDLISSIFFCFKHLCDKYNPDICFGGLRKKFKSVLRLTCLRAGLTDYGNRKCEGKVVPVL